MSQRVALKLSGEAFADPEVGYGIDPKTIQSVAAEIAEVHAEGNAIAMVVGGGNIFRGLSAAAAGMDRANADYMGMLATVINALALRDALEAAGCPTRVQTAIEIKSVAEPYSRLRAMRHLEKGRAESSPVGPGIRTSRPTRRSHCELPRSAPTSFSRRPGWTASTRRTPRPTPTPR